MAYLGKSRTDNPDLGSRFEYKRRENPMSQDLCLDDDAYDHPLSEHVLLSDVQL